MENKNLIMKSDGKSKKSIIYTLDAVSGIFKILFEGEKGEVYNLTNPDTFLTVNEFAEKIFEKFNDKVHIFRSIYLFNIHRQILSLLFSPGKIPSLQVDFINPVQVCNSDCGGHLASNLGIVELTTALHYVFDAPKDKFVFDVSHQTYCHKMLTGRKAAFIKKENYKDVTGFSNPKESEYDLFALGHTSTSVRLACGQAKARDLKHDSENVIAVIGDASLDGGEAFEALNCAAEINSNLIVVINDNEMSIRKTTERWTALKTVERIRWKAER